MKILSYITIPYHKVSKGISILLLGCVLGLSGCGRQEAAETIENTVEDTMQNNQKKEDIIKENEAEESIIINSENEENTEDIEYAVENEAEAALENTDFLIENPSEEYYSSIVKKQDDALELNEYITLELLQEEKNNIIDTEKWFADYQLGEAPTGYYCNTIEDDSYRYEIAGMGDGYSGFVLSIYEKETGTYQCSLDFNDYRYASVYKEEDKDFIEQRIWWAQAVDDILYVSIGHNTYTESSPYTGYLVAIDLNDYHVIWKSAPCTTNAKTFSIIDNTIVCGYGFTSEPDYLNLIDRKNGQLLEQIPIKSMAEYIITKDEQVYVRTYDTNYVFQIQKIAICGEAWTDLEN